MKTYSAISNIAQLWSIYKEKRWSFNIHRIFYYSFGFLWTLNTTWYISPKSNSSVSTSKPYFSIVFAQSLKVLITVFMSPVTKVSVPFTSGNSFFTELEFYATYLMLASDFPYVSGDPRIFVQMAKSFLEDDDISVSPSEKLCIYLCKIVKGM